MEFEFDNNKSILNKVKHGIDFKEAEFLWKDSNRIVIPAKSINEKRFLIIGKINIKLWSAIYTIRNEKIRIISVRRSREYEKDIYQS